MSTLSNSTADIEISHPELWTLALRLDDEGLRFIAFNALMDNSLIFRDIRFDSTTDDYLKALEDCIYDNPVLLCDFKRVLISVFSSRFVIVPGDAPADDFAHEVFHKLYPAFNGDVCLSPVSDCSATIVMGIPGGVYSFLQRTFNTPPLVHHLAPMCRFFGKKAAQTSIGKMFLYFHGDKLDLCAFSQGRLVMANSFTYNSIDDAKFFILHAWKSLGFDVMTDELQLCGDKEARTALTPLLREYITYVMPAIFPAVALQLGSDAIKAPFDLIILSLCV